MRPVRTIAAVVLALLTLLTAPAWAAAVAIQVSPSTVAAGDTVTVSGSVGPGSECATVTLISKAFVHIHDFAGLPAVFAAVKPDGAFTVATMIPSSRPAGSYTITGRCGGGNLGVSATLVVRAATSPTTTAAPAPPPTTAPPVPRPQPPAVTTPPTQPVSRWIIPGVAAVGGGTLAGLGVWLRYRRRHPAVPGR